MYWITGTAVLHLADLKDLGCSVTPLSNIATAIGEWGGKNFDSIHKNEGTLPWKCLVSCPKVWYLLQVKSGNEIGSPIIQETPLFDPDSCYHETLPMVLRMEDQPAIVRRSERARFADIDTAGCRRLRGFGRFRARGPHGLQGTVRPGNGSAQVSCRDRSPRTGSEMTRAVCNLPLGTDTRSQIRPVRKERNAYP